MSELEKIRERLRRVSLMGGPWNAQQMFDDARDLLVMVDDYREALELIAGTNGTECSSPRYVAGQALATHSASVSQEKP